MKPDCPKESANARDKTSKQKCKKDKWSMSRVKVDIEYLESTIWTYLSWGRNGIVLSEILNGIATQNHVKRLIDAGERNHSNANSNGVDFKDVKDKEEWPTGFVSGHKYWGNKLWLSYEHNSDESWTETECDAHGIHCVKHYP